ncbi:MAG TPA: hypothetical protein VHN19_09980 [Burkholderiales bacterium]|jgi:tripartite-type tricarboxylate transporter receptor subunit TctC|nr:hypothetical protein [Burkholderiales bacterium]
MLHRWFLAAVVSLVAASAAAQSYPGKPIKFVVPFPPGGNLDFVARSLQPKMQEVLGQPVLNAALAQPEVRERFAAAGLETVSSTPAEFAAFIRSEIAKWARVAKEANIRVE